MNSVKVCLQHILNYSAVFLYSATIIHEDILLCVINIPVSPNDVGVCRAVRVWSKGVTTCMMRCIYSQVLQGLICDWTFVISLFGMVFSSHERDKGTFNMFEGTSVIQKADCSDAVTSVWLFFILPYLRALSKAQRLWLIGGSPQTTKLTFRTACSLRTSS